MHAIVTVDKNWGIGIKGGLFLTIPEVAMLIRKETRGRNIIMSKAVADTFPGGLSPDRNFYVLTRDRSYKRNRVTPVYDIESLQKISDAIVLGGASVFSQLLPFIDTVDVTYLDHIYEADVYFENLDKNSEFELVRESDENTFFNIEYVYRRYERKKD